MIVLIKLQSLAVPGVVMLVQPVRRISPKSAFYHNNFLFSIFFMSRNASPHSRRIFLYQTGEGNDTHYDAITGVTAEHPVMQACPRPHSDTGAIGVSAPSDTGANAAPVPSDTNIIGVPTPSDNASLLPPPPQREAPLVCLSDTGDTGEELMMVSSV